MLKKPFLNDKFILVLILLNAAVIFATGFDLQPEVLLPLAYLDHLITALFIVELIVKLREWGAKTYFGSNWNRLDFTLVFLSIPSLLLFVLNIDATSIGYLLVFRVTRIFKSFRFLKFIPGVDGLIAGVQRALRASVMVMFGFMVYIFLIGILSFYLFRDTAPTYFSNPIISLYSTFKVFTVEGWYDIPEQIAVGLSTGASFFVYLYFIFVLLSGGIFGLSLVNSIFVDAMVSDNNDVLEAKVDELDRKISLLLNKHDGDIDQNTRSKREEDTTT